MSTVTETISKEGGIVDEKNQNWRGDYEIARKGNQVVSFMRVCCGLATVLLM